MRFVPVNCIKEGMILGRKIQGKNDELMLNTGSVIHASYIEKLKNMGYIGVYIDDDLSDDIQINEVISQSLRFKAINSIKSVFTIIETGKDLPKDTVDNICNLIDDITDSVLNNRNILTNLIDLKVFDDYTYYHSVNVGILSIIMGASLNLNKNRLCHLGLAAMLHDIGKVFISKKILNKPDKLTQDEFEVIKFHPLKGYEYLKKFFDIPISSYNAVLQHHERFDGFGYPKGFKGNKINLYGKIIAIADVYDALTSKRPYREAMAPSDAMEYIMSGYGSLFDPVLVKIFMQKVAPYPIGTCVALSNGSTGLVTENYSDYCLRPKIKIFMHGNLEVEPYFIDLKHDMSLLNVTITGIADNAYPVKSSEENCEIA